MRLARSLALTAKLQSKALSGGFIYSWVGDHLGIAPFYWNLELMWVVGTYVVGVSRLRGFYSAVLRLLEYIHARLQTKFKEKALAHAVDPTQPRTQAQGGNALARAHAGVLGEDATQAPPRALSPAHFPLAPGYEATPDEGNKSRASRADQGGATRQKSKHGGMAVGKESDLGIKCRNYCGKWKRDKTSVSLRCCVPECDGREKQCCTFKGVSCFNIVIWSFSVNTTIPLIQPPR